MLKKPKVTKKWYKPTKVKSNGQECVTRNGTRYFVGSKCPACSVERDTGGRLEHKTNEKRFALICAKCLYVVRSEREMLKRRTYSGRSAKVFF